LFQSGQDVLRNVTAPSAVLKVIVSTRDDGLFVQVAPVTAAATGNRLWLCICRAKSRPCDHAEFGAGTTRTGNSAAVVAEPVVRLNVVDAELTEMRQTVEPAT
jgi:hypothetical protein